jgi:hypothetical protein
VVLGDHSGFDSQRYRAMMHDTLFFTAGVTDLKALAESKGLIYEADRLEERVVRPEDGVVLIRVDLKPANMRGPKRKDPKVWMRAVRWHTYQGKSQDEGSVYLAYEEDVENIINLKMAVKEQPPRRAVRK